MHDTIEFEKLGIPATVVITQIFRNAAVFQFRNHGMEGHPYIELPHPVASLSPEDMRKLMAGYVDQAVRQLTA